MGRVEETCDETGIETKTTELGAGRVVGALAAGLEERKATLIEQDQHVILVSTDDVWCLGRAGSAHTARIGRRGRKVTLGGLVGVPWGSTFALLGGRGLVRCEEDKLRLVEEVLAGDEVANGDGGADGDDPIAKEDRAEADVGEEGREGPGGPSKESSLVSSGLQRLSQDDIEEMKARDVQPESILRQLCEGSATFGTKNEYAKEKYLRRKAARYRYRVRVTRPCARTVCQVYFKKNPEKTMNMRYDALGIMLNNADVRPYSQVLVVDECNGLLVSSAAERLGGYGRVIHLFRGRCPSGADCTRWMNFPEHVAQSIVHVQQEFLPRIDKVEDNDEEPLTYIDANHIAIMEGRDDEEISEEEQQRRKRRRIEQKSHRPSHLQVKRWLRSKSDALLIASRQDVLSQLAQLFPLLRSSSCFAIYNSFLQPLAEIQYALAQTSSVTRVQLLEVSMLHHQILPGRTHPLMKDTIGSTAGFVLSGIYINPTVAD